MAAVEAVGAVKPPETAQTLLADLIRSARWKLVREDALEELKKLDAESARHLASETGLKLAQETEGQANGTPELSAQQIADICVRHGVLTAADAQRALAESASRDRDGKEDSGSLQGLLYDAGRFLVFDVETGMFQNRHDLLLGQFAKASAGLFRPEAALERYHDPSQKSDRKVQFDGGRWMEEGKGKYSVQFIHSNKLYRFQPNDLGDWYDVAAVIKAIHRALEDVGIRERFVLIEGGDQVAQFVFARPEAIQRAAQELGARLGADLDQARKSGKDYEERVLRELKR